jgi:ADP-ribosyl-[dinitrogen reductase] hydrolase
MMAAATDVTDETARDRAVGALLGLAIGDAIGTTLEFVERDTHPAVTGMIGGGTFGLDPGQWTDDTSMALCLAESLLERGRLDQHDLMTRFVRWWRQGENSCTGHCFDIGKTTQTALQRFERAGDPVAGSTHPRAAGNGSLMRLAPVAVRWHVDAEKAMAAAREQSVTTHAAPTAVDGCAFFAALLVEAIQGATKAQVLAPRTFEAAPKIAAIAAGSWRGKARDQISSSGYVVHTLEAALWCVDGTANFEEAILTAVNLGDDADTVGAVTGQIAGALYGTAGIPARWRERVAWRSRIENLAERLFDRGPEDD